MMDTPLETTDEAAEPSEELHRETPPESVSAIPSAAVSTPMAQPVAAPGNTAWPPTSQPGLPRPHQKTPLLAAIFSFLIPGLGQVYNGLYNRALLTFGILVSLFYVAVNTDGGPETPLLVPALMFGFFFNVIDSFRQAKLANYGAREVEEWSSTKLPGDYLFAGAMLIVLGTLGLIQRVSGVRIARLLAEHWYVIALAVGVAMFSYALVQRRRQEETRDSDELI